MDTHSNRERECVPIETHSSREKTETDTYTRTHLVNSQAQRKIVD